MDKPPSLYDYFWSRVAWNGNCYLWTGPTNEDGYGRVTYHGERYTAHRLAWKLLGRGPIPDWMELDHLCRRRRCVNVTHLELVTPSTNAHRARHKNGVCYNPPCPSVYDLGKTMEDYHFLALMGLAKPGRRKKR